MHKTPILIITDPITVGGSITFIRSLAGGLLSRGFEVHLITFQDRHQDPTKLFPISPDLHHHPIFMSNGYNFRSLPRRLFLLLKTLHLIRHLRFSFVFTDLIYPTLAYVLCRFFFKNLRSSPLFHHIHGSFSMELVSQTEAYTSVPLTTSIKNRFYFLLEHFTLKHCQQIFVYSRYSLTLSRRLHGQLPLTVNKPGLDSSFPDKIRRYSKKTARKLLGLNPDKKLILFTSRIEPRKGVIQFFENLGQYKKLFPNTQFLVCSKFTYTSFFPDLSQSLTSASAGSDVILISTPTREQISLYYRCADVTVMPSLDLETFGFSTLESYYYRTPVVAFDVAANPELIPAPYLVRYSGPHSWSNLYKKIAKVIRQPIPIDYNRFNYSWDGYIDKLLSTPVIRPVLKT